MRWEEPTGRVYRFTAHSEVKEGTVTGIVQGFKEWSIEVDCQAAGMDCIFRDTASAEARRAVLHAEAEQLAQQNFEAQFKRARKGATWSVGYHRREIQELQRKLDWHKAKLGVAKKGSDNAPNTDRP